MASTTAATREGLRVFTAGADAEVGGCDPREDPIHPGDPVMIWGDDEKDSIQVLDIAESIGTIPYELTCGVSARVKRVYVGT